MSSLSNEAIWYLAIGFILISIGILSSFAKRIPITTSIIYLLLGVGIGRYGLNIVHFDLLKDAKLFEHISEVVVVVSLFAAGLKLRLPLRNRQWIPPLKLASISMTITVLFIAVFVHYVLSLPWGVSVLLGAILAPTDPVLASAVQVREQGDRDRLRFSLTAEAGLNDGSAFPFVMLGLGLMGLHDLGDSGLRWVLVDVLWSVVGGLLMGGLLGHFTSTLVLYVRKKHEDSEILDDFLALGLIALSYGMSHVIHAYGFLAVFAAGIAMRKIEEGSAPTSKAVLSFTEQMERLGEFLTVVFLGSMLHFNRLASLDVWLIPVLFLIIRPLSVVVGLFKEKMGKHERVLTSWFGIRGIGSIYYLTYAIGKGIPAELAERLIDITFAVIIFSAFFHGISAMPFMQFYHRKKDRS